MLLEPVTMALNCWLCPADRVTVGGLTETDTAGFNVTVALADLVESATLMAVTVTDCWLAIEPGAV